MRLITLEARVFLCKEAAQLYGLQQRKRKRGSSENDVYVIEEILIADLRELNTLVETLASRSCRFRLAQDVSSAHVITSMINLAHLVYLISHYLTLRLSVEITLPHRDYSLFSSGSSYIMREVVPFE